MNYLSEFEKQKAKRNELIKNSQQIYYLQTKKEKINVDAKKYVVLDVETNGLSSSKDDLLSISIFKPNNNKKYTKFLPLDLNEKIKTTKINGIKKSDLKNAKHLTQEEFNEIIKSFELDKRIILHYGNIEEKFIKNYLKRQKINGFERLTFFNFKKNIISSSFTDVNLSKDNLCKAFRIRGVKKVHSGINDCILEWKLFCKINNRKIFINGNVLYWYTNEYITPVSYLTNYTNFKYHLPLPKLELGWKKIKTFELSKISRYPNNISGVVIEKIIYDALGVDNKIKKEDLQFLIKNKSKLTKIFEMESEFYEIPIFFEDDLIKTNEQIFQHFINEINETHKILKNDKNLKNVVSYITNNIFNKQKLSSQELVVNKKDSILSLCDLSSEKSILEIKTSSPILLENEKRYFEKFKYQLYYQSNNRKTYLMTIEFADDKIAINFWQIIITTGEK